MESSTGVGTKLEIFEVGPCENAYQMGFRIGKRFSELIRSRLAKDLILQNQLLPFAQSVQSQPLIQALCDSNRQQFPNYWDELVGTAQGSGVPVLQLTLLNFRKEILPFLPKAAASADHDTIDDCSDVLLVSDALAIAAHNEDANVALVGHTYLIKAILSNGVSFHAYTYAGELPRCAFGFNSNGLAFTLNSVPPSEEEIVAGGIALNFISRDLLEATSLDDALSKIRSCEASVGHSYNLIDLATRRILNIETASRKRISVYEVGSAPFFHANMYVHLQVQQAQDQNSISRQRRADELPQQSKDDIISLLADTHDSEFPICMTGPLLYTLCTAIIDLDEKTLSIFEPREREATYVFSIPSRV